MFVKIVYYPITGTETRFEKPAFSLYDCNRARVETYPTPGRSQIVMEGLAYSGSDISLEIIGRADYYLMSEAGKTIDHFHGRQYCSAEVIAADDLPAAPEPRTKS